MKKKSSFVFTGDIGFDKYMDKKWEDRHLITDGVLRFLHSGDHVVANVEGALIDLIPQDDTSGVKQLIHAMNPNAIKVLNHMHADVWNLCNNHILDAGEERYSTNNETCKRESCSNSWGRDEYSGSC